MDARSLIILVLQVVLTRVQPAPCPGSFMAYNEKCFKIVETEATWPEAVIYCKENGATLATIDNVGEQNFLEKYISSANTVTNMSFNTGDDYVYHYLQDLGIDITGHSSITFSVQACNDAHVALSETKGNDNADTYEIVIGGWADSQSVIRDCKQCDNKDEAHHSAHPVSCTESRPFWISWSNNYIRVGSGTDVGVSEFMHWNDTDPHDVNYIAIATGWGSTGQWNFHRDTYMPGKFWIAGSDLAVEGEWLWLPDLKRFSYINWAPGEPDNNQGYQHCAVLDLNSGMKWRDDNCEENRNFICQAPLSASEQIL